jgi:hypothetical protein
MAKIFTRRFVRDTPQWNGQKFLLLNPEEEKRLLKAGVLHNAWACESRPARFIDPIGRFLPIGYGTDLPPIIDGYVDEWDEWPARNIRAWNEEEDSEVIRLSWCSGGNASQVVLQPYFTCPIPSQGGWWIPPDEADEERWTHPYPPLANPYDPE